MTVAQTRNDLARLATLRGIELSYTSQDGATVRASDDTLVGVLGALGYPVPNAAAIRDQLRLAEAERQAPSAADQPPTPRVPPPRPSISGGLGVTAPLYALRGRDDWGIGSFADLTALTDVAASWGATLVGTLPLLAIATDPPIDPSPYLPVSKLFWNELYVDVAGAAELAGCDPPEALRPGTRVTEAKEVDYLAVAEAKRRALGACADAMQAAQGRRREAYEEFLAGHSDLAAYADFRAKGHEQEAHYHRFVQYAASTQLRDAAAHGDRIEVGLYLDLPVGVHPQGYDTWAHPELFADAEVGAPPDSFQKDGQSWGFPPLHPEQLRRDGYAYFIQCLRTVLGVARAIRIDHILGMRRLYWIPPGADATAGAYVRYPQDELLAVLMNEAHRAGATVIGEDLGTVAPEITAAMDRAGILHSFVYQFEADPDEPLPQPTEPSAASLGNHDLPRFAAFWTAPDQAELVAALGEPDPTRALRSCLASLAAGPAACVIADLADLEGELEPDNRPGTGPDAGNWRRRLPRPVQDLARDQTLQALMTDLAARRDVAAKKGTNTQ